MKRIAIFVCGLLFGAGLTVSGMVNPVKVLNFLDIAGAWDPTLVFVMGAGLAVTFLGYRVVMAKRAPVFEQNFVLPTAHGIDVKLAGGAALFGLGWGLTGLCPGPAVASLAFGNWQSWVFATAMAAGLVATRMITSHHRKITEPSPQVEG